MAWIIAVTGLKGGVGKTTVTLTLATTLHAAGHRVTVIDADPQGTARAWASRAAELGRSGPAVMGMSGAQLRRDLESLARVSDIVIIDSPPRLGSDARAAMLVADLVLLPTTPGAADLWALQETIAVLEEARGLKDIRAAIVMNRTDRSVLSRKAQLAASSLSIAELGVGLSSRVAFGEAMLAGWGVQQHAPHSDAALQARNLTKAVLGLLGDQCQSPTPTSVDSSSLPSPNHALSSSAASRQQ